MLIRNQREFDAVLRTKLPYYIGKVFNTVEPVPYKHNWHIDLFSEYLQAILDGDLTRLIINIPPGYTKSMAVNVAFSTRLLGQNPKYRILSASHSFSLSTKMSIKSKIIMESDWYQRLFPKTMLKKDTENTQAYYKTTEEGFRQAVSVGGKITGDGGDILTLDDPIDASDANASSGILLQKCNDWFDSAFYTRLRDKKKGIIIVIMQRLHQNDLTGHLLASIDSDFEHCVIPAIEETKGGKTYSYNNFSKHRVNGDILFPEIEDKKELDKAKIRLGSYGFSGQYQQSPAPKGGGIFKNQDWQYFDKVPQLKYSIVTADTAMKTKEINDYSVFELWGIGTNGNAYLMDILRGKWEAPELETTCVAFWNKHKNVATNKLRMLYIEDKSSGTGLIQKIKRAYKIPIKGVKRDTKDKVERASGIVGYVESGYVFLKKDAVWLSDFLLETSVFPNGKHDDQVDPLSDALDIIYNSKKEFNVRTI